MKGNDPYQGKGKLVLAEPGDLILWDGRTIHGGRVGLGVNEEKEEPEYSSLARLSFCVCMTQKSRATSRVLRARRKAFEKGDACNHWPHEYSKQVWELTL